MWINRPTVRLVRVILYCIAPVAVGCTLGFMLADGLYFKSAVLAVGFSILALEGWLSSKGAHKTLLQLMHHLEADPNPAAFTVFKANDTSEMKQRVDEAMKAAGFVRIGEAHNLVVPNSKKLN